MMTIVLQDVYTWLLPPSRFVINGFSELCNNFKKDVRFVLRMKSNVLIAALLSRALHCTAARSTEAVGRRPWLLVTLDNGARVHFFFFKQKTAYEITR